MKYRKIITAVASFLLLFTANAKGQGLYSVFIQNGPLSSAMSMISSQCEYRFVYNNALIDTSRKITVSVSSDNIAEVLDAVFLPVGLRYTIIGKQIAISVPSPLEDGNTLPGDRKVTHTVTGTVLDSGGDVLAGASVMVAGTDRGTFADVNGHYSIEVDDTRSELIFDFIGMAQVRETVGSRSQIDITMQESARLLDQVVVTGYQTISKERSAGSFANIKGEAVRDQANVHGTILRSLEGRAAGFNVTETGDGVKYLIRGVSSINSKTEPLFIVDGVSMTRQQMDKMVNPNDVATVNFLKDATAASIWGAQAANGVVVVTTKTGTNNTPLSVSYNGSFSYKGKPRYSYQDMMNSREFIETAAEVFDPQTYKWKDIIRSNYGTANSYPLVFPHEVPMYQYLTGEISLDEREAALGKLSSLDGRGEYEKYFMSDAYMTNHSLSFSGGTSRSKYYASFEYQRSQGAYRNVDDDYRVFFRDNFNLSDRVSLDLSLSAFHTRENSHLQPDMTSLPYATFLEDGTELNHSQYVMTDTFRSSIEQMTGISLESHPLSDYRSSTDRLRMYGVSANAGIDVKMTQWLKYEGRFQYSVTSGNREMFIPQNAFLVREERSQATDVNGVQYMPSSGGHFTMSDQIETAYTVRNQLNADHTFGNGKMSHRINAIAGLEFSERVSGSHEKTLRGYDMQTMKYIFYDDYILSTEGVHNPAMPSFASASTNTFDPDEFLQTEVRYRFMSVYANGAYTLSDKYSLNASIRVDQSNLFGSDPSVQFKPIWSVGVIWNAGKESFMSNQTLFDRLNVRLSMGYAGNSPDPGEGGPYDILSSVSDPSYSRFGLGYIVATPANDKLTWEKTRTFNFGIDFSLFDSRIDGSLDLYDKNTTNLLAQTPIDPTKGFVNVLSNLGRMTNRGVEFRLATANIVNGCINWNSELLFTFNRNKLEEMYMMPPSSAYDLISYDYWEGYPYGTLFSYRWAGLDPEDGMPRVLDSKGDPVRSVTAIDTIDALRFMGSTVPPVFGSLTNDFSFGDFTLSVQFIYNIGHRLRNDVNRVFTNRLTDNLHKDFSRRWKKPGDEALTDIPAYYSLRNTDIVESDVMFLYEYADINILDASYIKLRDVSFEWNLPASACRVINAGSASVGVHASNLATISFNGQGIDPEAFYLSSGSRSDKFPPFISASVNIEF